MPSAFPQGVIGNSVPLDFGQTPPPIMLGGGGPTVYNQALTAALSFVGAAPLFAGQRTLTGALSFAGSLTRSAARRLVAAFAPTGTLLRSGARRLTATFTPAGALLAGRALVRSLAAAALNFIGGTQLYPDPALYPGPDIYPYGGSILFQLNRLLPAVLQPVGFFSTHLATARTFTATLQPHVAFLKTSARIILSASFSSASLIGVRASHTVAQALFASLRNAGALSTGINPGHVDMGGGGFGVPMPDSHFQRYKPTLRRQKMRV